MSSNQSSLQQVIIMAIYICNVFKLEFITASNYYGYLHVMSSNQSSLQQVNIMAIYMYM